MTINENDFNERFKNLRITWRNKYIFYQQELTRKIEEKVALSMITENVTLGSDSQPVSVENTIKINDWKILLSEQIQDLSNVIEDMKNLRDDVINDTETNFDNQELIADSFEKGDDLKSNLNTEGNELNDWKNIYEFNLNKYNNRKQTVHGALLQAKENTEIYNINVSATVNIIAGVLILLYLIYNLFNEQGGIIKKSSTSSDTTKENTVKTDNES